MALGDLFASTRNRSPLQTPPLGQLPGFITGSPARALGFPEGDEEHDPDERRLIEHPIDTGNGDQDGDFDFTTPEIGEIPQNVQDLLALFDLDPDTPGIQGDVGQLAGMSAEQIATFFDFDPESAKFFQPVQTGLLQEALTDIGETRTFGLGQAQDILNLGTTQARQQFGAQAAGLRSGLLGMANLARRRQAASGFAGAGAGQAALGAGRREAQQRLGQAGGAFRTGLTGLQERFETAQEGVQTTARGGIRELLNMIAGQVAGFGTIAADLTAGGAKRLGEDEPSGGITDIPEDSTQFPAAFSDWLASRGINLEDATQSDWERFIGRTRPIGGRE